MGTSATLSSPKGRIPFEKGWLDTIAGENAMPAIPTSEAQAGIAPRGRFQSSKINLGKYLSQGLSQGDDGSLKRALGKYSEKGMGGTLCTAEQMKLTASMAAKLVNLFEMVCNGSDPETSNWATQLTKKALSPGGIVDAIINRVLPSTGGSLDEASLKRSLALALFSVPEINLLGMTIEIIGSIAESFVTHEIFNQVYRNIGQLFERPQYSSGSVISATESMRSYIQTKVVECIQEQNPAIPGLDLAVHFQKVIENIFKTLEEEV